jgi:CBS domain-containing protein
MKRHFVNEIMSKDVVTINPDATMLEAAKVMGANRIGRLIVETEGEFVGIITERDLLSKVLAKGKDPELVRVKDAMSSPLITIRSKATIKEAAQTMISEKGRLAVYQEEQLVGVITASDLIKSLPDSAETSMKIDDVMTKNVITAHSNTSVEEIAKLMGVERIGSVIVTKGGKPFGIFTERDLLTTFLARGKSLKTRVGTVASHPLITIPEGTSIHQTALTMALKHIRRLPIVRNSRIVGIITARDLVEAYSK